MSLWQGGVDFDFGLCIQFWVKTKKGITCDLINFRLRSYAGDGNSKPNAVPAKGGRLGGHAAQNWWLLRFLPVIMHDRVRDANNAVWRLFAAFEGIG